ncbi:hypothetical protein PR202_ga08673 [Eleusine coracana subsp. coracana]|uniref:Uncharacterized protein n=1 Tax=Eleusine coracana subsp. coracana TaxID=191504 RepID=A0AAV5C2V9_ELECO|nr:hypothetical protein PR202_ga08673 [Eleusine coracana subsp. coracana]
MQAPAHEAHIGNLPGSTEKSSSSQTCALRFFLPATAALLSESRSARRGGLPATSLRRQIPPSLAFPSSSAAKVSLEASLFATPARLIPSLLLAASPVGKPSSAVHE